MIKIRTNTELCAQIQRLVDYNYDDEARDFEERENRCSSHIFHTIKALNNWLNTQEG